MRRVAAAVVALVLAGGAALALPTSSVAAGRTPHAAAPWSPAKGIAVSLTHANLVTDAQAMTIGSELFSMLRTKLHANAVSLNFPFWQAGSRSNDPHGVAMTATPGRLAMLTELAHRYGLSVQYRPFLYEGNLTNQSRPSITPTNVGLWFKNYWAFLEPYLASADEAGAASFSVAVELTSLLPADPGVQKPPFRCATCLSQWSSLVSRARAVFPGSLVYSQQHLPLETIPLTDRGFDAYQPVCPSSPTVTFTTVSRCRVTSPREITAAAFTRGFEHNLELAGVQSTPQDLTIEELGIAAVAGAYDNPNDFRYPLGTAVDRPVQTAWFAGACNAFRAQRLAGIYFWSIDFDTFTPSENANHPPQIYNWLGTPTATAIASCFASTP
jgi:hypothetical protein